MRLSLLENLPGFGELFRWLSYQEIGSRAIASRAIAGVYQGKLVFPSRFNQRCPPGYATIDFARTRSPSQPTKRAIRVSRSQRHSKARLALIV